MCAIVRVKRERPEAKAEGSEGEVKGERKRTQGRGTKRPSEAKQRQAERSEDHGGPPKNPKAQPDNLPVAMAKGITCSHPEHRS